MSRPSVKSAVTRSSELSIWNSGSLSRVVNVSGWSEHAAHAARPALLVAVLRGWLVLQLRRRALHSPRENRPTRAAPAAESASPFPTPSESCPKLLLWIVTPVSIEVPLAVEVRLPEGSQCRRNGKAPKDDENRFELRLEACFCIFSKLPSSFFTRSRRGGRICQGDSSPPARGLVTPSG